MPDHTVHPLDWIVLFFIGLYFLCRFQDSIDRQEASALLDLSFLWERSESLVPLRTASCCFYWDHPSFFSVMSVFKILRYSYDIRFLTNTFEHAFI